MLPLLTAALAAVPLVDQQHEGWINIISIHQEPASTSVDVIGDLSDADRSVVRVVVPGFFARVATGGDGNPYTRLDLPGWASTTEDPGAPELPVLRFHLAVPPGAGPVVASPLTDLEGSVVSFGLGDLAPDASTPPPVWPVHTAAFDADPEGDAPNGVPEGFAYDAAIYGGTGLYPVAPFDSLIQVEPVVGGVEGVLVELRPFRWNGLTDRIEVIPEFEIAFDHPAPLGGLQVEISPSTATVAEEFSFNFTQIKDTYSPPSPTVGDLSSLLVVGSRDHLDELLPLIDHRRALGLDVEFQALEDLGFVDSDAIKAVIDTWGGQLPAAAEGYVLLVGTSQIMPFAKFQGVDGESSDAAYGADAGVHVGRLAPADEAELATQVAKILATELEGKSAAHADQIGLVVAGNYDGSQSPTYEVFGEAFEEVVQQLGLAVETTVMEADKSSPKVAEAVALGKNALMYRGPGSLAAWPNADGESHLTPEDLAQFDNDVPPFHWALAPSTADVASGGSLAEAWMRGEHGAVAVYGASATTPTNLTHEVGHWLGVMRGASRALAHGMLLDAAEFASEQTYHGEIGTSVSDRFQLVGDPSMVVPTGNSAATDDVYVDGNLVTAENWSASIGLSPNGGSLTVRVEDENGDAVDGALVSLVVGHSTIGPNGELVPPPFQTDVYTEDGDALLSIGLSGDDLGGLPTSQLAVRINVLMGDGSVVFISENINLLSSGFQDVGGQVGNVFGQAPRLWSIDQVEGGETLELQLENGRPLSAGALFVAFQHNPVPFEGGQFHPLPVGLSFPFATDLAGEAAFVLGPLPDPIPAELKLVFQAFVVDPAGPAGLTLSNGLIHAQ